MKKVWKWVQRILILLLVGAIFFIAGTFFQSSRSTGSKITSTTLKNSLVSISELSTMEYNYTHVGSYSDSLELGGFTIPFTQKKFILTYNGTIKAGYDMNKTKVSVNGNKVSITMPKVKILSHEIDENSIKVYDQTHNIFNQITVSDFKKFQVSEKKKALKEAVTNGLYTKAQSHADEVIKNFIKSVNSDLSVTIEYAK